MLREFSPEPAELGAGLALPLDGHDVVVEFFSGLVEGVLGGDKRLARILQIRRVRSLDQVEHRVELGAFEARLAEEPTRAAAAEPEAFHHRRDLLEGVSRGELALNQGRVLLLLLLRGQFWLLFATHQLFTPCPS
ncbi:MULTISPECIES: hypothetical protein [unclassified Streptomyces]|uniref:hypothetical protein n=1 Tax=unclassified Streptomyces TaxID=2593676 RepID=UPI00363F0E69